MRLKRLGSQKFGAKLGGSRGAGTVHPTQAALWVSPVEVEGGVNRTDQVSDLLDCRETASNRMPPTSYSSREAGALLVII